MPRASRFARRPGLLVAPVLAAILGAACGPISYVSRVTVGASSAVEQADAAGAAKGSPYWYTRARLFLRQARIEAADADFEAANRFGRLAEEAARAATAETTANGGKPPAPPVAAGAAEGTP